jgi:hypothetical protein
VLESEHRADQASMVTMSRRGKHVTATRSGHHVPIDEPELVVRTIRDVLAEVRK